MEPRSPKQALLLARLVWVSFAVATVVYTVVAHLIVQGKEPPWEGNSQHTLMRIIFAVLAVINVIAQQVLHLAVFAPWVARAQNPEERARFAMTSMIVRTVFLEAIALFGLILAILFGRFIDAVIFGAVALALMPITFPLTSNYLPPTGSDGPWYAEGNR